MKSTIRILSLLLTLSLAFGACEDNDNGSGTVEEAVEGPLYVLSNATFGADGASYVTVVSDLNDPTVEINDLSQFIEFPGVGTTHGLPRQDVAYFYSGEDATITEIEFAPNGSASLGREISLAGLGINNANFSEKLHVSPTKAYLLSEPTSQVVVWNPQSMEIITSFPLGLVPDAGNVFRVGEFFLVDDQAVFISGQADETNTLLRPGVTVTVIDTTTNQIVSSTTDERSTFFSSSAIAANGDRYFGPNDNISGQHFLTPEL